MTQKILETYDQWLQTEQMPRGKKKTMLTAIHLFSQQGFNGTSTAQIAEVAGISQATIFKYFRTKDDLLRDIVMPLMPTLFGDFFTRLTTYTVLEDAIDFMVRDRLMFLEANHKVIKIFFQEAMINQEIREVMKLQLLSTGMMKDMLSYLNQLKDANPQIAGDLTPTEILRIIVGPIFTYFVQRFILDIRSHDHKRDIELISHQIIAGLNTHDRDF